MKQTYRNKADVFFAKFEEILGFNRVDLEESWDFDHICYRVETEESYHKVKSNFLEFSNLLGESLVGGRLIATFKLTQPLIFRGREIFLVELPMPKSGSHYQEGFQHIEVVCALPFEELQKKYSHLKQNIAGLKKEFNKELEIKLGDYYSLKFHHQSLEDVIKWEKSVGF